jgi:hypothetical protein
MSPAFSNIIQALLWVPHNVIGHPVMSLLQCVGLQSLGYWVHNVTEPPHRMTTRK